MTALRFSLLVVALFASFVPACYAQSSTAGRPNLKQLKLSSGVTIHYVRVALDKYDVRVLAARVPLVERAQQVQRSIERSASGYTLDEYQRRYRALAVLSGGYIDDYSPPTPLGMVRSNGVQFGAIHRSWLVDGFYCARAGHAVITRVDNDQARNGFRDCVQSGPLLLLDKQPVRDPSRDSEAPFKKFAQAAIERGFVCLTGTGEAILAVTEKIDLPTLTATLRQPEFNCVDAIGLTGAGSAGLRINDTLVGKDKFLYPSIIAVLPRAN